MSLKEAMAVSLNKKLKNIKKMVTAIGEKRRQKKKSKREDLQQSSYEIFGDENATLRRQTREKQVESEKIKQENNSLKEKLENKETLFEEDRRYLCEEINSLKEQLQKKQTEIENTRKGNETLKQKYKDNEAKFEEEKRVLRGEIESLRAEMRDKEKQLNALIKENVSLREVCERNEVQFQEELKNKVNLFKESECKLKDEILKFRVDLENIQKEQVISEITKMASFNGNTKLLEDIESLKTVLQMKQEEIKNMRLALAEGKRKEERLENSLKRMQLYKSKCEDFQEQLQRKCDAEQSLVRENSKLRRSFLLENNQKRRLSFENEELQWKLKRDRKAQEEETEELDDSPSLPKVKRVIRKRESIGYVL